MLLKVNMPVLIVVALFLLAFLLINPSIAYDREQDEVPTILESAEKFFLFLKSDDFKAAWSLLSEKSHEGIIDDVFKASGSLNAGIKRGDVVNDFNDGGVMFRSYWQSFVNRFDVETILEHSLWEMGNVKKEKAEVVISFSESASPTILQMHKENDNWKVGLVETFWPGKGVKLLRTIFQ